VANKRQVKRSIKQLQRIKTWQLVILLILASLLAATFLRLNNIGMVERRNAVFSADKAGVTPDIQSRLYDLQRYVNEHMNSDSGQIYLEHQYARDAKAAVDSASNIENPNGNIYAKASEVCDHQFAVYSQAYLHCFVSEIDKYPSANNLPAVVDLPRTDLYRHEFLAPWWSPDFAGWSVAICAVILLMIITRIISLLILKALLKRHYSTI
jgi:hypothetical protein